MSSEPGFNRLSRKVFQSDLWTEDRALSRFEAWLDLIATASFANEDKLIEGRSLSLQRGDLVASVRFLAKRWRWKKNRVETFLALLKRQDRIRTQVRTCIGIITLCKYETYNSRSPEIRPPPDIDRTKIRSCATTWALLGGRLFFRSKGS